MSRLSKFYLAGGFAGALIAMAATRFIARGVDWVKEVTS